MIAWLNSRGIQTGIHYPIPVHLQPAYADLGYRAGDFPVTESVAARELSLPLFPEMTASQVAAVAEALCASELTTGLQSAVRAAQS
jgi:dTDP-4-amino-4,6-dideoxygalactose transaminase